MNCSIFKCPSIVKRKLRTKFLLGIIVLASLIMSATIIIVERQMSSSIVEESNKRGLSIVTNLSAMNMNYITTYNYVGIEQTLTRVVKENDLQYALVQYFDGELAAFSGNDILKPSILEGEVNKQALSAKDALFQYVTVDKIGDDICDISTPVFLKSKKWATVRVGISQRYIEETISETRTALIYLGVSVLLISCLASIILSNRVTRPVAALVDSVEALTAGDYDCQIKVESRDEIGYLAQKFSSMKHALKDHIDKLKSANESLLNNNTRLQGLFEASQKINALDNQKGPRKSILEAAIAATGSRAGFLTIIDERGKLKIAANKIEEAAGSDIAEAGEMFKEQQKLLLRNPFQVSDKTLPLRLNFEPLQSDLKYCVVDIDAFPNLEILSVPLRLEDTISGFINLIRNKNEVKIGESERRIISVLASHAGTALYNRKLFLELDQAYISSIKSLAKSLEYKDSYTFGHSERVAKICMKIGEAMGLVEKSLGVLHTAALLHDIGKIGVIESILNKKSKLDRNEVYSIKKHPEFGYEILKPTGRLQEERTIIRHHHEREDGQGYPDGLTGNQLSILEKIIIVADAFDAMDSKRAYRNRLDMGVIKRELVKNKGTQFDPDVVDVFLDVCEQEPEPEETKVIFMGGIDRRKVSHAN